MTKLKVALSKKTNQLVMLCMSMPLNLCMYLICVSPFAAFVTLSRRSSLAGGLKQNTE